MTHTDTYLDEATCALGVLDLDDCLALHDWLRLSQAQRVAVMADLVERGLWIDTETTEGRVLITRMGD
jgi:hypothetical protein